jgi:hypothetical protein
LPSNLRRFAHRFAYAFYKSVLCFPDEAWSWLLEFRVIERIARSERPDIILSTSQPNTCHIIAARLAARHGVPWAADLRDLWSQN